ncbi:deoxynucleotide monophosphate kinase family protein [Pseudoalteromonas sp. T1lg22]|uniref:deoxynucleotide monophosphate kinase family protein n=1 Tax=Pseudoalteromonas sp. T1lg22 TaxID=2077096 RepID=UPI000CF62F3F|nr:hypothetical protein [Pseudoalteromonas sp. T1lg22]
MLIGLTGQARCGKDTFASFLREFKQFEQYAFALPIKNACREIFGWSDDHVNGALKDEVDPHFNVSPRKAMQTLGTEWGRNLINSELWLQAAKKQIAAHQALIITDVRFENEAKLIRDQGGIVIKIIRPEWAHILSHCSEDGIGENLVDKVIVNDGSLDDLRAAACELILRLEGLEQ